MHTHTLNRSNLSAPILVISRRTNSAATSSVSHNSTAASSRTNSISTTRPATSGHHPYPKILLILAPVSQTHSCIDPRGAVPSTPYNVNTGSDGHPHHHNP